MLSVNNLIERWIFKLIWLIDQFTSLINLIDLIFIYLFIFFFIIYNWMIMATVVWLKDKVKPHKIIKVFKNVYLTYLIYLLLCYYIVNM